MAATINARWDPSCTRQSLIDDVTPLTGSAIQSICWLLHARPDVRRVACFWRNSTDNIAVVVVDLSLQEGGLQVNVPEGKQIVRAPLTSETEAW